MTAAVGINFSGDKVLRWHMWVDICGDVRINLCVDMRIDICGNMRIKFCGDISSGTICNIDWPQKLSWFTNSKKYPHVEFDVMM